MFTLVAEGILYHMQIYGYVVVMYPAAVMPARRFIQASKSRASPWGKNAEHEPPAAVEQSCSGTQPEIRAVHVTPPSKSSAAPYVATALGHANAFTAPPGQYEPCNARMRGRASVRA